MTEILFLFTVIAGGLISYYVTEFLLNKFYVKRINLITKYKDGTVKRERLSKARSKALYELFKKHGEKND